METMKKYLEREFGEENVLNFIKAFGHEKAQYEFRRAGTSGLSTDGLERTLEKWTGDRNYGRKKHEPITQEDHKDIINDFMGELVPFLGRLSTLLAHYNSKTRIEVAEKDRIIRGLYAELNYHRRQKRQETSQIEIKEYAQLPS